MVKSYNPKDFTRKDNSDTNNKKKRKVYIEETDEKEYLKIWDINPSFKDIHSTYSLVKTISLLIIMFFIIISCYLLSGLLLTSILLGITWIIVFVVVFHDEFYPLRYLIPFTFRSKVAFNPFEDFTFWYEKDDASTLFISNKKDLVHIALRIFQVDVIPENIHSAVHQFVRALSLKNTRLSYSYQIVQKPLIPFKNQQSRDVILKSLQSRIASIYFTVFYQVKGILTEHKIDRLKYYIKKDSNNIKSNLVSNFHHFRATLLSDNTLVNAVRTIFTRHDMTSDTKPNEQDPLKGNNYHTLGKLFLSTALILYIFFVLLSLNLSLLYIIPISVAVVLSFILIWFRSVLFYFTKSKLVKNNNIITVNPFKNIDFYRIKKHPYSLFLHIDNRLLIGMKMVNLKYMYQTPFCLLGKFIESLNNHRVHFSYTLKNEPLSYYEFYHSGLDFLNEKYKELLLKKEGTKIEDGAKAEQWLGYRYGMWYSTLTMAIYGFKFVESVNDDNFNELEDELIIQIDVLKGAFNINFQSYELEDLRSSKLISGYLFTCMKTNFFRLNGTHLNYLMIQGARMYPLTEIVDILKKGTQTKIAAEFNTPLYLENFINIGHTLNTEVLEREVPVGFTRDQLKNLLITNGTSERRDAICMKIVTELIKTNIPSLIFDFTGDWSKLLSYFQGSHFQEDILYFKYGSAFIIDPTKSDISYDQNNTDYLKYMLDAFGLALKKDERTVEIFQNTIQKNPNMDLGSIRMALQSQSEYEKNPISDSLLSLFSDFTQDDLTLFQPLQKDSIVAFDFVSSNKTVIVDLSVLREMNKKIFLTFVILAKIIHYVKNNGEYCKKFIIIPYIDVIFDSFYLDLKRNYDKIDLFLNPLVQHDFGLIFSANQIHYLHANFLLYFNNLITMRATDRRDIAMLRNLMNLQELHGTGIYTSSRKNTYQINYLMDMKKNEVLIRRDDINQPFPAYIEWEEITKKKQLLYDDIIKLMANQGFDLNFSERKILEQARKTLFEIDLGHFVIYLEEIIKFLDEIKTIDQIGNLYKHKLKTELKEIIYPKASKKTTKKENIKRIRDELFDILVRQGYLEESHPRRASGSEALRTSYSVGDRYQQALDDYYEVKGKAYTDINVEIMEKEIPRSPDDLIDMFQQTPRKYIIQKENLKIAIAREFSDFNYDIFNIYSYINDEDYKNALKIEHGLIKHFLINVYKQFYNVDTIKTVNDFENFLSILGEKKRFPFTTQELNKYLEIDQTINLESETLESLAKDIYLTIYDFFIKIQHYIYDEE